MALATKQYTQNPLIVDAVQVTADNMAEVATWCGGTVKTLTNKERNRTSKYIDVNVINPKSIRQGRAFVGDFVLATDKGYKVFNPTAFANTFREYSPSMNVVVNQAA